MVSSRRSRIVILTALTIGICLLIFAHPKGQQSANKFLESVEEKTRLGAEILKEQGDGAVGNSPPSQQDLSNEPGEPFDAEKEYKLILKQAPIMIFSKSYCPHSKFVKDLLLTEYQITPKPYVVELDKHPHGAELQAHIGEVTGRTTVPNVHVMGRSRGGGDQFRELHKTNTLVPSMETWGKGTISVKRLTPPSVS